MARFLRTALLLLVPLTFVACLDDSPFVPKIEDTNFAPELGVDLAASTETASGLYYRDVVVGDGEEVPATGAVAVVVSYSLYLRTGQHIQTGVYNSPIEDSIDGFEEGIRGMRVGGQRQVIIPPHLGYGATRIGDIPPNSILVYDVELTGIN